MMEFTTPPSYGSTTVNVGGIATDGELVYAGPANTSSHVKSKEDTEVDWPEPTEVECRWNVKAQEGKDLLGLLSTEFAERTDRMDVMAEVPGFVKQIVAGAAGTRPYIYQASQLPVSRLSIPVIEPCSDR